MSRHIEARFEIANWDETPFDDNESPKLTEALVSKKYSGDIEGTSTTKWLMAYAPDKTAAYVGIERIKGTVGDKRGSPGSAARRRLRGRRRDRHSARRVGHRRPGRRDRHRQVPRRSGRLDHPRSGRRLIPLGRREAARGHRAPPPWGDTDQALALVDHRLPILGPVGMLAGDRPVVVHQRLDGVGQVDDLARPRRPGRRARRSRRTTRSRSPCVARRTLADFARCG